MDGLSESYFCTAIIVIHLYRPLFLHYGCNNLLSAFQCKKMHYFLTVAVGSLNLIRTEVRFGDADTAHVYLSFSLSRYI